MSEFFAFLNTNIPMVLKLNSTPRIVAVNVAIV